MPSFGELLRNHRERARMSQGSLAEVASIDKSYISKLESGRREVTSRSLALSLAEALGLSAKEVEEWLICAGYVSPRLQAMVARSGASWLMEGPSASDTDRDSSGEVGGSRERN